MQAIVNLLNEIGMLSHTPRSGFAFLGTGKQSVAEHSYRMTLVAYALASMSQETIDTEKLLLMCLWHDLPEARTGDFNYVNKRYAKANEDQIIDELKTGSILGPKIADCLNEYNANKTLEAHLAHDADQIELLLVLKGLYDTGNPRALDWFDTCVKRLQTDIGKALAKEIRDTPSDAWWLKDKNDSHWIDGGKNSSFEEL